MQRCLSACVTVLCSPSTDFFSSFYFSINILVSISSLTFSMFPFVFCPFFMADSSFICFYYYHCWWSLALIVSFRSIITLWRDPHRTGRHRSWLHNHRHPNNASQHPNKRIWSSSNKCKSEVAILFVCSCSRSGFSQHSDNLQCGVKLLKVVARKCNFLDA